MNDSAKSIFARLAPAGAVLLLAFTLRAIGLTWGLPNAWHVTSYNCDEYTIITSLQQLDPARLKFNPVSEKDPYALAGGTFHLYSYGAAVKLASLAGYLTITRDKKFYYENPGEWARFFLTGRALSLFYGVMTVWLVLLLAESLYGRRAALLAGLLAALTPALAVNSRYMVANAAGAFWIILAFYLLKRLMDSGRTADYLAAGAAAGAAIAARFSAAPLLPMVLAAHLLGPSPKDIKKPVLALLLLLVVFLAVTPYAVLDYPNFQKGLSSVKGLALASKGVLASAPAVAAQLSEALGPLTLLLSLAGIAAALAARSRGDLLLLLWVLPLLGIFFKAGEMASAGRMLPVLPFLAILGARVLDAAWRRRPAFAMGGLLLLLLQSGLFYAAGARLVRATDIRDTASAWLAENVPAGASIGLVKEPSWFSPGAIDRHYRHPDHAVLPGARFARLTAGDWSSAIGFELLASEKPDLVVLTSVEARLMDPEKFYAALAAGGYEQAAEFRVRFWPAWTGLGGAAPDMFYTPEWIRVFSGKNGRLRNVRNTR